MESKRNIYLNMKSLEETHRIVAEAFDVSDVLATENVPVPDAVGRVLARPVQATISAPHFNAAAMDGLAVKAEMTFGAGETTPKTLNVGQDVFYVNTGHVMPEGTDAVTS